MEKRVLLRQKVNLIQLILVFPDRIPIRIVETSYNFDNPDRDISIHFLYLYKNYMIRSIFICFLSKINKQLRVINFTYNFFFIFDTYFLRSFKFLNLSK